jgi:hypothetical protein
MASKMDIALALANLEAGKFSFRMVDAIKEQLEKLESEVTLLREQHVELTNDLRLQQIANWRLEGETTRLNAKIHSLVRANALTEKASHTAASAATHAGESLRLFQEQATPLATRLLEKAIDGMAALAVKLVKFAHKPRKTASPASGLAESLELLKRQISAWSKNAA